MELNEKFTAERKAAQDIVDAAKARGTEMTEAEAKAFDEHIQAAKDAQAAIAKLAENTKALSGLVIDGDVDLDAKDADDLDTTPISERFMRGAAYKDYQAQVKRFAGDPANIQLPKTHIASLDEFEAARKDGGNALTTALAHVQAQRLPAVDLVDRPAITLLDIISRGRITSDSVEYLQITNVQRATAIVPENTGDETNDVRKPESTLSTNLETAKVYQYADGYTVTNQMLRDGNVLAAFLDNEFRYSFDSKLADTLINGSGTNGEPKGLLNATGLQAADYATSGDEAMNLVKAIRQALTKLRLVGASANAILINPADAEKIDLLQDTTGRFLCSGPWVMGPTTVWSRPLVESEQVDEGTVIVGDFHQLELLDRTGLSIEAFNQHKDYASRNLVYVRAELAAAQLVWRPRNFVVLSAKAATNTTTTSK